MRNAQSGRRRGRGNNPRPPQGGGREMGNRTEPRQRGNAMQLLEKYTNLARDAQQQGDRVQAEYYMQYADHYHRVVAEMRARHEERQAQTPQQDRRPHDRDERDERQERDDRSYRDERDDERDGDEDDAAPVAERRPPARREPAPRPAARPAPAPSAGEVDDDDLDDGAMRTLARSARVADAPDGGSEAAADATDDKPRRGRGRPRRQPRDTDAEREPVDA